MKPKAEPGNNEGPKAQSCDLGAKRSGIRTAKVKKFFEDHDGQTDGRTVNNDTISYADFPKLFFFVFQILLNFLHQNIYSNFFNLNFSLGLLL